MPSAGPHETMDTIVGFVLGVAGSLAAACIWAVMGDRLARRVGGSRFSLSGAWLAAFEPISPRRTRSVELVTMLHSRDTVRFRIENYNSVRSGVLRLRGLGKYRSSQLSAVYWFVGRGEQDSGTFVLRSRSTDTGTTFLTGLYMQIADREETGDVSVRSEEYTLRRIELPFTRRLRRIRHGTYFENYEDLKIWLVSVGRWDEDAPIIGCRATSESAQCADPKAPEP